MFIAWNIKTLVGRVKRILRRIWQLPKRIKITFVLALLAIVYTLLFVIPTTAQLSYSGETCVDRLTFLPAIHKTVDETHYEIEHTDVKRLGNLPLVSSRTCFTPTQAPTQGDTTVSTAPWGSIFARKHFSVQAGSPPTARLDTLREPVPVTKPLSIDLSSPDVLFEYEFAVAEKTTPCDPQESSVMCDITALNLEQGKTYDYALKRAFSGDAPVSVGKGELKTLKAVEIKKGSITNEQTVYSKPKTFTIDTDKILVDATVVLQNADGNEIKDVGAETSIDGKQITLTLQKDLPRDADYQLVVQQAEAEDGSTLAEPYALKFTLSGGPEVADIDIGKTRVSRAEHIILSFDQALAKDAATFVSVDGGEATVTKISDTQVRVSLQNLPKCKNFTVRVAKGVKSKHDVQSSDGWSYSARTICHSISTIGYSRQGRAINAYHFGDSGPVTLFVGALHGNEVSSSYLMSDWINELEANPQRYAGKRVVVVPRVNPDGVVARTRNNAHNVNLNRNFPTDDWVKDINDTNGPVKGGGGEKPLSEPEAKALASLSTSLSPRLMLSYHAVGSVVIGDPGGYSASYAAKYASMVGYGNRTGQSSSTFDYNITGSYESWTIEKAGIPSIVVELSSYTYRNIYNHREAMWAMLK